MEVLTNPTTKKSCFPNSGKKRKEEKKEGSKKEVKKKERGISTSFFINFISPHYREEGRKKEKKKRDLEERKAKKGKRRPPFTKKPPATLLIPLIWYQKERMGKKNLKEEKENRAVHRHIRLIYWRKKGKRPKRKRNGCASLGINIIPTNTEKRGGKRIERKGEGQLRGRPLP